MSAPTNIVEALGWALRKLGSGGEYFDAAERIYEEALRSQLEKNAAEPMVAIPKAVQVAGTWAACQAEPIVALLLSDPEGTDHDMLTTLLVRLQQLVGAMGSALQWERGDAADLARLKQVVPGVARGAS